VSEMKDAEWDNAINRALESYTAGEPEPGFAERIIVAVKTSRRTRISGNARVWALSAAATLAFIVIVTLWMKSEHLQIAILHINVARPAAASEPVQVPAGKDRLTKVKASGPVERGAIRWRDHAQKVGADAVSHGPGRHADATDAGDEQLAAEGVEPIVFKPIEMAAIRMKAPGQESQ
jgi:hypothetical protein